MTKKRDIKRDTMKEEKMNNKIEKTFLMCVDLCQHRTNN